MSDGPAETGVDEGQERFNLSMRKFLKQVGVTSQAAIESAVREGREAGKLSGDTIEVRVHLTGDGGLDHTVEGHIQLP